MQLSRFRFEVTGVSPLLMHNAASMAPRDPGVLKGAKKSYKLESLDSLMYIDAEGQLYLPSAAFRNAMIAGSKGRRIAKVGAAGVIAGSVFPVSEEVTLVNPKTKKPLTSADTVEDRRSAINWNCKPPARIIAIRPRLNAWGCTLELEVDTELVSVEVVLEILQIAGKIIGVGAFRVEKKGTFGRYDAKLMK